MFKPPLTAESILERLDEYDLFEKYFQTGFKLSVLYLSPFRRETNPSFNIYLARNYSKKYKLFFKDFGINLHGNVFYYLSVLYHISITDTYKIINKDFKLDLDESSLPQTEFKPNEFKPIKMGHIAQDNQSKSEINPVFNVWNSSNYKFWGDYSINKDILKFFRVTPIKKLYINNNSFKCGVNSYAYCYYIHNKWFYKIYQPYFKYKFLNNLPKFYIEGIEQLEAYVKNNGKAKIGFLTKSLKDAMLLTQLGYPSVSLPSETSKFQDLKFLTRYYEELVLFFDNDDAGCKATEYYVENFKMPLVMSPFSEYKDVTDFCKDNGLEKTRNFVKLLLKKKI